jgi:hypothetical protein
MKKYVLYLLIVIAALACKDQHQTEKIQEEVSTINDTVVELEEVFESSVKIEEGYQKLTVSRKGLVLQYDKVTLCFDSIDPYSEQYYRVIDAQNDSVVYYLDLGENIDNQYVKVVADSNYTIQIYQQVEASVTIMNEGPHCDLVDWSHYNSPWRAVHTLKPNQKFQTKDYRDTNWEDLFLIDLADLKAAALEHCGDRWYQLVKDAKSPYDYPFGIGESKIILKIVLINKVTHKKEQRIAVFYPSMGC